MNRSKSRNGTHQIKKKVPRSVSQECPSGTKRRNGRNLNGSGINFEVNVSASGTNLNKKIEDEMSKLEDVEKKIRGHKTKAKAICETAKVSTKAPNERKLKHILEDMLGNLDTLGMKQRKIPKSIQKLREIEKADHEKIKRCIQNGIKMASFTNLKQKCKNDKRIQSKKPPISKKSSLKKPTSAPSAKSDSLARDLKFAESLNFGKDVDFHLSISDMQKIVVPPKQDVNDKIVVEKTPRSNATYIYDSTSYNNVYFDSSDPFHDAYESGKRIPSEIENNPENEESGTAKKEKPERKRFYSYLKRGNFTISQHTDKETEEQRTQEITTRENSKTNVEEIIEEKKTEGTDPAHRIKEIADDNKPELSVFPTDLIERSILAVENVLRTINSITKDFSGKKGIEEAISMLEDRPKLIESTFGMKMRDQQDMRHSKSFLEVNFDRAVKKDSQKDVVTLKSPIRSFYASEDLISSLYTNTHIEMEENQDPLTKAMNSLRNERIETEHTVYVASEHTYSFSSCCSCVTVSQKMYGKRSMVKNVFADFEEANTNFHPEKSQCSNLFPEYNFQKCLSLLRKKFRDFDTMRRKNHLDERNFEKIHRSDRKEKDRFERINLKNDKWCRNKDGYEVCFKNDNFQSETSIESCNKFDMERIGLKVHPSRGKARSTT